MPIPTSLFPRFLSQYRGGQLLHAKFLVQTGGATPVFVLKNTLAGANFQGLSLTGSATGLLVLTLAGGAKQIAVLQKDYVNIANPATPANFLDILHRAAVVESTGVVNLVMVKNTDGSLTNSVATDEIHITLYVDK